MGLASQSSVHYILRQQGAVFALGDLLSQWWVAEGALPGLCCGRLEWSPLSNETSLKLTIFRGRLDSCCLGFHVVLQVLQFVGMYLTRLSMSA